MDRVYKVDMPVGVMTKDLNFMTLVRVNTTMPEDLLKVAIEALIVKTKIIRICLWKEQWKVKKHHSEVTILDLKYRKIIARCKPLQLCARYIMYNSGFVFYKKAYKKYELKKKLHKLKDSKKGKMCFLVGNGPSLRLEDLNRIKDMDCFAANEIYRIFEKTDWRPKCFLIMDRYSKTPGEVIDTLDIENIFLGDYYLRYHEIKRNDIICLHQHYAINQKTIPFSNNIEKCLYNGATVTYGLMQIIAYMGYSEVYMLGFDHNYSFEFALDGTVVKTNKKDTHFFKDDVPEDIIANVRGMTRAYESFKRYADINGIKVRNATRGGKLEVFERVDFDSLFI